MKLSVLCQDIIPHKLFFFSEERLLNLDLSGGVQPNTRTVFFILL